MRVLVAVAALCALACGLGLLLESSEDRPPETNAASRPSEADREALPAATADTRNPSLLNRSALARPPSVPPAYTADLVTQRNQLLLVRAIDETGTPVPAVQVRLYLRVMALGDPEERWIGHDLPPTDPEGLAQAYLPGALGRWDIAKAASVTAVLYGGESAPLDIDPLGIPREPVDVVLPAFGSMEIALLGPDGLPWRSLASQDQVYLKPRSDPDPFSSADAIHLGPDGHATLFPVLCGEQFRVQLPRPQTTAYAEGPRFQGDHVRIELRMSADLPVLTGRVVESSGQPVSGDFWARYEWASSEAGARFATDGDGQFRVPLEKETVGETLTIKLRKPDEQTFWRDRLATHTTDVPIRGGMNELGELVLAETPLLVSGRVESIDHAPFLNSVMRLDAAPGRTMAVAHLSLAPTFRLDFARQRIGPDDPYLWERDYDLAPQALGDGRFAVHGHPKGARYRIRVMEGVEYLLGEPVEFSIGTEDLLIRVERAGEVVATIDGDSAELLDALRFRLVPVGTPATGDVAPDRIRVVHGAGLGLSSQDGRHRTRTWRGLSPGLHHLTIGYPGTPPIVDLNDIDVPRGGTADDPRLAIDLRGRLARIAVTVLDPEGEPIRGRDRPVIKIRRPGPEAEWYGTTVDRDGQGKLFVPGPVDLLISAPSFRTIELSGVHANTTVYLQNAP